MPQRCSVPFCCNYGGHQFPKDKQRRFQWRVAIKRLDPLTKKLWEPNDRDVVCHLHFVASDYKDTSGYSSTCSTVHCTILNSHSGFFTR